MISSSDIYVDPVSEQHLCISVVRSYKGSSRLISAALYRRMVSSIHGLSHDSMTSTGTLQKQQQMAQIVMFEFSDNEQFSCLDTFLTSQISDGVTLYIPEENNDQAKGDCRKVHDIISNKPVQEVIYMKKSSFQRKVDTMSSVLKLVGRTTHTTNTAETEMPLALGCVDCLIQVLGLLESGSDGGNVTYDLCYGSLQTHMRLDSAAADAINLLPKPDHPSQFGSLYGVLNRCRTKLGSRLLNRWLRQPLLDVQEINSRLDAVQLLVGATQRRNELRDGPLRAVPDLDGVIAKMMHKSSAGLDELFRLYVFVRTIPSFSSILQRLVDDSSEGDRDDGGEPAVEVVRRRFLTPLLSISGKFSLYEQLVEHVVDMQHLPELRVNCQHDEELQQLVTQQDELLHQADRVLHDARNGWASFADVKLERSPQHGFILRTTRADDERTLRGNNSSVRVLSLMKNGVHFTTPALERLAGQYLSLQAEYDDKQSELVAQAVDTALTYMPVVESVAALLAELDVLVAFATAAALSPGEYVRPVVHPRGTGVIDIKGARHPCVELMDSMQQFIANDYDLIRGRSSFQVITGPNMGGKSTYIRAVGCIAVLAQVGMFVPCSRAEVSVVDCILTRVGAGDAVQKGISTFMAEMLESAVMLQTATPDSLIIIDELGRGTSTFDGFGLAWSISDYIIQQLRCPCLFATHFHELTALAKQYPSSVTNKHVAAHVAQNQVVMLYHLSPGPCTQSFGIHVATSADFPPEVIREAKRKAAWLEGGDSSLGGSEREEGRVCTLTDEPTVLTMLDKIEAFGCLDVQRMPPSVICAEVRNMFRPVTSAD